MTLEQEIRAQSKQIKHLSRLVDILAKEVHDLKYGKPETLKPPKRIGALKVDPLFMTCEVPEGWTCPKCGQRAAFVRACPDLSLECPRCGKKVKVAV